MDEGRGDEREAQTGEELSPLETRARRRRRKEIVEALAEASLTGSRRSTDAWRYDGRFGRRLGGALVSLGPVFSAFGQYLASRPDVLSMPDCVQLASMPERSSPTPLAAVRERLEEQLGVPVGALFSALDMAPQTCGPQFQTHHAWLSDEGPVTVKLLRPEWEVQWAFDAPLLSLVAEAIGRGTSDIPAVEVVADFCESVERQIDLIGEAGLLARLAIGDVGDDVRVPKPLPHLSSAKVLTRRRQLGEMADACAAFRSERTGGSGKVEDAAEARARRLARRLCRVWLRLVLRGCPFPVSWLLEDLLLLPDGPMALTGGLAIGVPEEDGPRLRDYMVATATGDLDAACSCLLGEMEPCAASKAESVRLLLRQAVPFPHGGWSPDGPGNSLAEQVMTHWRLVRLAGCRPKAHTLAFLRGLCGAAALAQRLAPEYDAMREALDEVRVEALADQLRELLGWCGMSECGPKMASVFLALPGLLDQVLSSGDRLDTAGCQPPKDKTRHGGELQLISVALLVSAVLILVGQVSGGTASGERWREWLGIAALLAGGALLWRNASGGSTED